MECPYCKAGNRDGVRYCSNCGKLLNVTTPAPLATGGNGGGIIGSNFRSLTPSSRLQGGRYVIKKAIVILLVDSPGQIRMELPVLGQFFK